MKDELPEGWEWTTLEAVAAPEPRSITDGPFGSNLKTAHYTESGPRVIRLQNIGDGEYRHQDAHISEQHYETLRRHSVEEGDLVVASLGEVLPRACLIPASVPPAIVKADCIRVRLGPDVDPRYVNYALQRPRLRDETATVIKGVGRPRLGMRGIKALAIPLAPLADQKRIVAHIEEHLSRLEAANESLASAAIRADQLRSQVLAGELQRATQEGVHMADLLAAPLANGRSVPTADGDGFPVLRLTCLGDGLVDTTETKVGDWGNEDPTRFLIQSGDFLISRGNGSLRLVGLGGLVAEGAPPVAFPDTLIRARVDASRILPDFLRLVWHSRTIRRQIETQARTTAGIYKINQSMIEKMEVPVPDLQRQGEVVDRMKMLDGVVQRVKADLHHATARSSSTRRAILSAAFSGALTEESEAA